MRLKVLDQELYEEELLVGFRPKHRGDAGIDLRLREDARVEPGVTARIGLGVAVAIPWDHVGWIIGRGSAHAKLGLMAHVGAVDAGYRGEIHAMLTALSEPVELERGDRAVQLIVTPIQDFSRTGTLVVVKELPETSRGEGRFGSTGRN